MEIAHSEDREREVRTLAEQADLLLDRLGTSVDGTERFLGGTPEFRLMADYYERLASAQRNTDVVKWERTIVSGRNGQELMDRIWKIRQALHEGEL